MENNDQNLNNQVNTNNSNVNQQASNNTNKIVFALMALIIVGLAGYIVYTKFIQKDDKTEPKPNSTHEEEKKNINYDVLNYQCKNEYCDGEDYINVKQLLNANDTVIGIYGGKDFKNHVVRLKSASGNQYLYLVDDGEYYFKNDNYYETSLIYEGYENDGKNDRFIYDYNYAIVHQKTENKDGYNTKIYSFKNKRYVLEMDEYISDNNDLSCAEYENQRFYKLTSMRDGKETLYDADFNKIIDADNGFALDNKYIFGEVEENSEYKFFRYNRVDKKFELSKADSGVWTYNYIAKYNNDEYEIYDFDGNFIFRTDEKTYLKEYKTKKYGLPEIPYLYYSKAENKIIFMIHPDICGDESCPEHSISSYYIYDMASKKITHKFSSENIPDANGYITL